VLSRQESSYSQFGTHKSNRMAAQLEDCHHCNCVDDVCLKKGSNEVEIPVNTSEPGSFRINQLRLRIGKLIFVSDIIYPSIVYNIQEKKPSITVDCSQKHSNNFYCGVVFPIQLKIDVGDRTIDENNKHINIKSSAGFNLLNVVNTYITDLQGFQRQILSSQMQVTNHQNCQYEIQLPCCTVGDVVTFQLICVVDVAELSSYNRDHTNSLPTGLTIPPRHRRSKSAPLATFIPNNNKTFTPSNKPQVLDHTTDHMVLITEEQQADNKSVQDEHESDDSSDDGSDDENDYDDYEMTEVSLLDEADNSEDEGSVKEDNKKRSGMEKMMEFLTPSNLKKNSSSARGSKRSLNNIGDVKTRSSSVERIYTPRLNRRHTTVTPSMKSRKKYNKIKNSPKMKQLTQNNSSEPHCDHNLQLKLDLPWNDFMPVTTNLRLNKPVEMEHTFVNSCNDIRYVYVKCENVTDHTLKLNCPQLDMENCHSLNKHDCTEIRPDHSCTFAWKADNDVTNNTTNNNDVTKDDDVIVFSVNVTSQHEYLGVEANRSCKYKFHSDNTKTIYKIRWVPDDDVIKVGIMTSFELIVTKHDVDADHETTNCGQQLLMYRVIDKRGGWAICGKSSGILSYNSDVTIQRVTMEVMALLPGNLHLPDVTLHRYIKRGSEFDEKLSSTDSPVLKPPKLKEFKAGQILSLDKSRVVRVVSQEFKNIQNQTKL